MCVIPILVADTGSSNDEILDGRAGVGLLRSHIAISEQEPIERHGLRVAFILRLVASHVRLDVIRSTKTRPPTRQMLSYWRIEA